MKIRYTRAMLNAALDGELDGVAYVTDARFGFEVPTSCPGVPEDVLQPRETWGDGAVRRHRRPLAQMFNENFARYRRRQRCRNAAAPAPFLRMEASNARATDRGVDGFRPLDRLSEICWRLVHRRGRLPSKSRFGTEEVCWSTLRITSSRPTAPVTRKKSSSWDGVASTDGP